VASVVGLVSIRIFGYRDPRAEMLAEETGIAFQLTNILRDVAEDAARNRVYLPLDELTVHRVSVESLLHRATTAPPTANERTLLEGIARRAEDYYRSARELLPLIDPESRPALWVLVAIYHALLKRIVRADYDVFSRRASVTRKARHPSGRTCSHGLGADLLLAPLRKLAAEISLSSRAQVALAAGVEGSAVAFVVAFRDYSFIARLLRKSPAKPTISFTLCDKLVRGCSHATARLAPPDLCPGPHGPRAGRDSTNGARAGNPLQPGASAHAR
jgi:hypothetical protein